MQAALLLLLACAQDRPDGAWLGQYADRDGTIWRTVWSFRSDGTVLGCSPRSSLEDFLKGRALTEEERKSSGTYEARGGRVRIRWADGKEAEVGPDAGSFKWGDYAFKRLDPWKGGKLTGHFECVRITNMGTTGSHFLIKTWTFHEEGLFQQHDHSTVFSEFLQTESRDTERLRADGAREIWRETWQRKVPIHKSSKESFSGRYRIDRSAAALDRNDAKKGDAFIAVVRQGKGDEPWLLLIDGWLHRGTPGKFPEASKPDAKWVKHAGEGYELSMPPDWEAKVVEQDGRKVAALAPKQQVQHGEGAMLVLTSTVDPAKKAHDADVVEELRKVVRALPGFKLEDERVEYERIDGAIAVRILMRDERKKAQGEPFELPIEVEAHLVVRGGTAVVLVGQRKRSLASGLIEIQLRDVALSARITAPVREKPAGLETSAFDLTLPKEWKAQEVESEGYKHLVLLPPGMKWDPEDEPDFAAHFHVQAVVPKDLAADLKAYVKKMAPDAKQEGDAEALKADGEAAVRLRFVEKSDEGTYVIDAYAVAKHGKTLWMVVSATADELKKHGAAARAAFESIRVRK